MAAVSTFPTLYKASDDIFHQEGVLKGVMKVHGRAISALEANRIAQERLTHYELGEELLRGAQLFCGAPSASLLAFTDFSKREGALYPVGLLKEKGLVPFSGELSSGDGLNRNGLSTTWIGHLDQAMRYASSQDWYPEIGRQRIAATSAIFTREVQEKRLAQWKTLTVDEKWVVALSFPVLYGVKSARKESHKPARSSIPGEIGLRGGALPGEVRVVFVPRDKVKAVSKLLAAHGHLQVGVEPFTENMKGSDNPIETNSSRSQGM